MTRAIDFIVRTLNDGSTLTATIYPDEDCESPRLNDNLTTIWCWHRRYDLGDDLRSSRKPKSVDDYREWLKEHRDELVGDPKPLYMYDHSGITISLKPFGDPWDSGQVGVVLVTRNRLKAIGLTSRQTQKIRRCVEAEIEEYDTYLRGECYGYKIEHSEDGEIDSCWGFIGIEHIHEQIKDQLNHFESKYNDAGMFLGAGI